MPLIKSFPPNTLGRDFVIGDLHGSYEVLLRLLEGLKFDAEVDRMFSTSDLIDRGPDSLNCLRLLKEPWFHCVLANHEQMMLEAFRGGYMGQFWFRNGGNWGFEAWKNDREVQETARHLTPAVHTAETLEILELVELVSQLPLILTIQKTDGTKVHVLHAEIPPVENLSDADLESEDRVRELASIQSHDGDFFVWGRHRFYEFYNTDLSNRNKIIRILRNKYAHEQFSPPNLSPVISGHTILQQPMTLGQFTNIDTCAFGCQPDQYGSVRKWAGLTCVELGTWKFYQATASEFREREPFVVNTDDLNPKDQEHGSEPSQDNGA